MIECVSKSWLCESEARTHEVAALVARSLQSGDILLLSGPLGSGKTTFTRELVAELGGDPNTVSSPTFVLCQEYELPERSPFKTIAHIDAYRLSSAEETAALGLDELLEDETVLIIIEWPEIIADTIPHDRAIRLELAHAGETARNLTVTAPAQRLNALN